MYNPTFIDISLDEIHSVAEQKKADGWRYVQTMCTWTENGVDYMHSFYKEGEMENYQVRNLAKGTEVPSISDLFFSAFVFENEAHDLYGVNIKDIAIDFGGNFYALAQKEPMTILSPAKKAAMEKAKKAAAAKAAKEAKAAKAAQEAEAAPAAAADADAELEAKLAAMDPEKAAKVRKAMEAKAAKAAKEAQAAKDAEMEAKLAAMDPEKAAKVRKAMEAKAKKAAAEKAGE